MNTIKYQKQSIIRFKGNRFWVDICHMCLRLLFLSVYSCLLRSILLLLLFKSSNPFWVFHSVLVYICVGVSSFVFSVLFYERCVRFACKQLHECETINWSQALISSHIVITFCYSFSTEDYVSINWKNVESKFERHMWTKFNILGEFDVLILFIPDGWQEPFQFTESQ